MRPGSGCFTALFDMEFLTPKWGVYYDLWSPEVLVAEGLAKSKQLISAALRIAFF